MEIISNVHNCNSNCTDMISLLLVYFVFTSSVNSKTPCEEKTGSCKLESLGCFDDNYHRALPELLINERDQASRYSNGISIDWYHFSQYLNDFACRCAEKAAEKGYNIFGLQFYGECWSGPDGQNTYDRFGPSKKCIDGNFKHFRDDGTCMRWVGRQWTNHVYRIATPGCEKKFEPIGCFKDDLVHPRPLPNYISNERDYNHKYWNGHLIAWETWETYSAKMICRCATLAQSKNHTYFSLQFWGECWSGAKEEVNYARNGKSTSCKNEYFKPCICESYNCVGMAYTNYVYKLKDDESLCVTPNDKSNGLGKYAPDFH